MDGLCTLYPPKCKFLTPFKWQKKKRTRYFRQSVQDAIMIQAENNNISLTEFSNVSGHFMEDVKNCKLQSNSRYGHLSNTDTSKHWLRVMNWSTSYAALVMKNGNNNVSSRWQVRH